MIWRRILTSKLWSWTRTRKIMFRYIYIITGFDHHPVRMGPLYNDICDFSSTKLRISYYRTISKIAFLFHILLSIVVSFFRQITTFVLISHIDWIIFMKKMFEFFLSNCNICFDFSYWPKHFHEKNPKFFFRQIGQIATFILISLIDRSIFTRKISKSNLFFVKSQHLFWF